MKDTTLVIKVKDRYDSTHEREITQAEFESDEAFIERAAKMLAKLREEAST